MDENRSHEDGIVLQNLTYCPSKGGIDNYLFNLVAANPGISFDIFAVKVDIPSSKELPNVRIRSVSDSLHLPRFVERILMGFDPLLLIVLYLYDRFCLSDRKALRICRHPGFSLANTRRPTLFLMATALPEYIRSAATRKHGLLRRVHSAWKQWFYFVVEGRFARTVRVATLSLAKAREISRVYGLPIERIVVNPPGVDASSFHYEERSLGSSIRIVCVSRLSPEKNVELLIKTVAEAPNLLELEIVGDGPDRDRLMKLTQELGVTRNVHFAGFQLDIHAYLADAHVCALVSTYEGFGHVFLEAMATGLPCIGLDSMLGFNVATREIIDPHSNGMLIDNNPVDCLTAITYITADAERYRQMSLAARRTAERFSWTSHLQRIREELENVR